jgi:3'-5' exoribonuclease
MPSRKPPLLRLSEMAPGQFADCFVLLAERSKHSTRDGKPFYHCRFRDARRVASVMVWADSSWFEECESSWREGQFYKVRAQYGEHDRFGPQLELENIRAVTDADRADGFEPTEFAHGTRFNPDEMLAELREIVTTQVADVPLRKLVLTILERHGDTLKQRPATRRHYFAFPGGLLEHTLSVTRNCLFLVDRYRDHYPDLKPGLNRDLVIAGAVLHDIGRVLEYDGAPMAMQPTVTGRLLGHILLARDLVRDTARELGDVDPELLQLLEHLILSHLNHPEWGSPRLPLVPECLILHHADDLDAKLDMYARCLTQDTEDGPFTARDPMLKKELFKGRKV